MSQGNLLLKKDLVQTREWTRRQIFEEERKARIFSAEERSVSIPKLQLQKTDKQLERARHADLQQRYDQQDTEIKCAMRAQKMQQERDSTVNNANMYYYRCKYQGKPTRREWDINDPSKFKESITDFSSLGPSSAQVLSGHDDGYAERKLQARAQFQSWLDQQHEERLQAEAERKKSEDAFYQLMLDRDKGLEDQATAQNKVRQAHIMELRDFNLELARQQRLKREREKREEREDDLAEIMNTNKSDLMTQNPDVATSKVNPNKKVAYLYRGMSEEELAKFREDQRRQAKSLCERVTEERLMHTQWEQYFYNMGRELGLKDLHWDRLAKANTDARMQFNQRMIEEHKQQRKNMYDDNKPQDLSVFYQQFNKNSR